MTEADAIVEARRRWGANAWAETDGVVWLVGAGWIREFDQSDGWFEYPDIRGDSPMSFEEAFANANAKAVPA